jgi:membrane-associated phospholipid phosphatase
MTSDSVAIARRLYLLAVVFVVAAVAALTVDLPVAQFWLKLEPPGDAHDKIHKVLELSEVFAHGFGIVLIGLTIFVLDKENRRALFRVMACAFGSGMMANVIKLLVGRTRPNASELPGSVTQTFVGWLPVLLNTANWRDRSIQSFPSGHTAAAVGLAIGLSWLYPRGRWLFAGFALLAALQRIDEGAHYLSDTCGGAALACIVAGMCIDPRILGRWFDRLEGPRR